MEMTLNGQKNTPELLNLGPSVKEFIDNPGKVPGSNPEWSVN